MAGLVSGGSGLIVLFAFYIEKVWVRHCGVGAQRPNGLSRLAHSKLPPTYPKHLEAANCSASLPCAGSFDCSIDLAPSAVLNHDGLHEPSGLQNHTHVAFAIRRGKKRPEGGLTLRP